MKCQHCGKNEATFYFKSNINGEVRQVHLCQECAVELGYTEKIRGGFRPMNLFAGDEFFARTVNPWAPLFGGLGARLLTEFPSPVEAEEKAAPAADLLSGQEQEEMKKQRQKNALEAQLKAAVAAEDFEAAAKLRDELRQL